MTLLRHEDRTKALRDNVSDLLSMEEPRRRFAGMMSGLDIRYDLGDGHPLVGRRMPNLDLVINDGPMTAFTLLHAGRGVLLEFDRRAGLDAAAWTGRVRHVAAEYIGGWELPVLGRVGAPAAVLVRPAGYVAWVGDGTDAGLVEALTMWFGAPAG